MDTHQKLCLSLIYIILAITSPGMTLAKAQPPAPSDYIIGSGDMLNIQVWDHSDLHRTVEVGQDGTFSFPFIGKVQASGKSIYKLEAHLTQKLADGYLVAPQVTVGVSEYKNKKVFLFGEVARPGSYILRQNMHLLELISEAGGFTDGLGTKCTVIRASDPEDTAKPVSIEDASEHETITVDLMRLSSGDPKENILIKPNDSIHISSAAHLFVTGEVKIPGEVEYTEGMTVRQAISMAGGGTPKAAIGRTQIVRMENGRESVIKPDLSDVVSPNDVLKVPESYF